MPRLRYSPAFAQNIARKGLISPVTSFRYLALPLFFDLR